MLIEAVADVYHNLIMFVNSAVGLLKLEFDILKYDPKSAGVG